MDPGASAGKRRDRLGQRRAGLLQPGCGHPAAGRGAPHAHAAINADTFAYSHAFANADALAYSHAFANADALAYSHVFANAHSRAFAHAHTLCPTDPAHRHSNPTWDDNIPYRYQHCHSVSCPYSYSHSILYPYSYSHSIFYPYSYSHPVFYSHAYSHYYAAPAYGDPHTGLPG